MPNVLEIGSMFGGNRPLGAFCKETGWSASSSAESRIAPDNENRSDGESESQRPGPKGEEELQR